MTEKKLLLCVILFLALYLAWSAILIAAAAKSRPKTKTKQLFDERQIAAQGTAYKAAFWAMLVYSILYAAVSGAGGIVWCDPFLGIFLGVIVGVTVFAVICIFRDAYFRPDQSRTSMIVLINVICGCQGVLGFMHVSDGTVIEDGVLTADSLQLFLLLTGLILDAAFLVKHRMEKHGEQE